MGLLDWIRRLFGLKTSEEESTTDTQNFNSEMNQDEREDREKKLAAAESTLNNLKIKAKTIERQLEILEKEVKNLKERYDDLKAKNQTKGFDFLKTKNDLERTFQQYKELREAYENHSTSILAFERKIAEIKHSTNVAPEVLTDLLEISNQVKAREQVIYGQMIQVQRHSMDSAEKTAANAMREKSFEEMEKELGNATSSSTSSQQDSSSPLDSKIEAELDSLFGESRKDRSKEKISE